MTNRFAIVSRHANRLRASPAVGLLLALQGQHDGYLVRQLNHYRQGLRGARADDAFGAQMVPIMSALPTEQDVIDVVAYIDTL